MSGFVALVNRNGAPVDPDLLQALTRALAYRGPDRLATWHDGPVGLGHAHFATTREAWREDQPASRDGVVRLVANARVDAREELLAELGAQLPLDETPDTDLILRAWARWGEDALDHLLGDYAFALWDGRRRELFCARDRFGMRSLYYAEVGNTLVVSNGLPCLRRHPDVSDRLDDRAIGDFLLTGEHGGIDRSLTMYADVKALPPAHALVLRDGRVAVRRTWQLPTGMPPIRARRAGDVLHRFRHVFEQAVADRLRTDRAVIALGGGVDSPSVAATVRDLQAAGQGPEAFSAVSLAYDRLPLPRERPFVAATARRLGLDVDYLVGDGYRLLDPPVATTAPIELYQPTLNLELLKRVAARGRVHLTGAAGDNLLLGAPVLEALPLAGVPAALRHVAALRARYGALPSLGTGLLARLRGAGAPAPETLPYPAWLDPAFERAQDLRERWRSWWASEEGAGRRAERVRATLTTPDWSEEDVCRPEGFVRAEERDPFLDLRVVELVLALPSLPWLHRKHVLREAMRGRLPKSVLDRPKTVLGELHQVLLERPEAAGIDRMDLPAELERYVVRRRMPRLAGGAAGSPTTYVGLRPVLLGQWLRARW